MNAGKVDVLVILGGNPVYTAPADLQFADAMDKVPAPRPPQPLRRRDVGAVPLADSRGALPRSLERRARVRRHGLDRPAADRAALRRQVGARAARGDERPARAIRRTTSSASTGSKQRAPATGEPTPEFETAWRRWLHDGVVPDTAFAPTDGHARSAQSTRTSAATGDRAERRPASRSRSATTRRVLDGRFANNGWLQELPKPITKLTWDNAVLVSPATAERLKRRRTRRRSQGGEHGQIVSDVVELQYRGPHGPRRAVPGRRASRRLRHRPPRLRPHARRPRRRPAPASTPTRSAPSDALWFGARRRGRRRPARRYLARLHAVPPPDGRPRHGPRGHARRVRRAIRKSVHEGDETPPQHAHAVSRLQVRGLQVGHGDRPQRLHRLQRLRRRLPGREQHPGRRQGPGAARPRDALAPRRHLLPRPGRATRRPISSRCRACTARTRRARSSARSARPCTATKG